MTSTRRSSQESRRGRRQVDPAFDEQLGARIRHRRLELGLSQGALATALGLTFQQVQKYEKGANQVSVSRLLQLTAALRVPLDYFFPNARVQPARYEAFDIKLTRVLSSIRSRQAKRALLGIALALAAVSGADASGADRSARDKSGHPGP